VAPYFEAPWEAVEADLVAVAVVVVAAVVVGVVVPVQAVLPTG
jgi:flagellar biosynthesis protein FliQ